MDNVENQGIKTSTVLCREYNGDENTSTWMKTFSTKDAALDYTMFCLKSEGFSTELQHSGNVDDSLTYYTTLLGPILNGNITFYYITGTKGNERLDITIQEELALPVFTED